MKRPQVAKISDEAFEQKKKDRKAKLRPPSMTVNIHVNGELKTEHIFKDIVDGQALLDSFIKEVIFSYIDMLYLDCNKSIVIDINLTSK